MEKTQAGSVAELVRQADKLAFRPAVDRQGLPLRDREA
jgi:hypothetical protein